MQQQAPDSGIFKAKLFNSLVSIQRRCVAVGFLIVVELLTVSAYGSQHYIRALPQNKAHNIQHSSLPAVTRHMKREEGVVFAAY
jgi:hypothetical protein